MRRYLPSVVFILVVCPDLAKTADPPWKINEPIVTVEKSLYLPHPPPPPWALSLATMEYVGSKLELLETRSKMSIGDVLYDVQQRVSTDNGRTWSDFRPAPNTEVQYNGVKVAEHSMARFYDDQAGVLVGTFTRILEGFTTYAQISRDYGATWSAPQTLRFEEGDEFDPQNPAAPGHHSANKSYGGNNIIRLASGKLLTSLGWVKNPDSDPGDPKYSSSLCFAGTWHPAAKDYQWTPGKIVTIPPDKSAKLVEAEVAELQDGRVLVVWRGVNTSTTPGRKWYSISTDGGMTLSPVAELKYDDGSSFYSPESFHRMIRSRRTGKLYWIGNITAEPPDHSSPRYPLVIAEVDETTEIPSLLKSTVSVIDTRQPDQQEAIQFTNFSLLEDRETEHLQLYMTVNFDNVYKYIVTFQ